MVNSDGQLFTIEGVAAGLIMLLTAVIVVGTTSIYTPGDTHISDMQLEQLGSDTLHMMNIPNTSADSSESDLQSMIKNSDNNGATRFRETFLRFCNNKTGGAYDNLQFSADIYFRNNAANFVNYTDFSESRKPTGGEHAVRVTEWVQVDNRAVAGGNMVGTGVEVEPRVQAVLVEVLLWRD
jgi:hypothetical protein